MSVSKELFLIVYSTTAFAKQPVDNAPASKIHKKQIAQMRVLSSFLAKTAAPWTPSV